MKKGKDDGEYVLEDDVNDGDMDVPHVQIDTHVKKEKKKCQFKRHVIGYLLLLPLLIFHFVCFMVTISMGIGVGILVAILHEIWFDQKFYAFWQTYISLIVLVIIIEIFFRVGFDTSLSNWINREQKKHRVELYYIPRSLYILGYIAAICLLFYAYQGAHRVVVLKNNSTIDVVRNTSSAFDGEGDILDGWTPNPLSLSPTDDHFHYSLIFFIALAYMMYTISKENDWVTHRRSVMQSHQPDPIVRGGIGNFVLFLGTHILMTCIYGLPLLGSVLLCRQFFFSSCLTYSSGVSMAVLVGIGSMFFERRQPFPTKPMHPPVYAFENHLRIRMAILQLWLLPSAAGRYFDANRAITLDAQNDDLLFFTIEVGIGIVQVIKIFGNDLFLLKVIYNPANTDLLQRHDMNGLYNDESGLSITQSTQTLFHENDFDYNGILEESEPKMVTIVDLSQHKNEPDIRTADNRRSESKVNDYANQPQNKPKVQAYVNQPDSEPKVNYVNESQDEFKVNTYADSPHQLEPISLEPSRSESIEELEDTESQNPITTKQDEPNSVEVLSVPSQLELST